MAMGKAVITTQTESLRAVVVDGETGYHVRPGDVDGLRAKMAHLLAHPDEAKQLGLRARQRMEQYFSVEAYCQRIEQTFGAGTSAVPVLG
jgi:glycosyltransferase involved in cell wall biosynthesis